MHSAWANEYPCTYSDRLSTLELRYSAVKECALLETLLLSLDGTLLFAFVDQSRLIKNAFDLRSEVCHPGHSEKTSLQAPPSSCGSNFTIAYTIIPQVRLVTRLTPLNLNRGDLGSEGYGDA